METFWFFHTQLQKAARRFCGTQMLVSTHQGAAGQPPLPTGASQAAAQSQRAASDPFKKEWNLPNAEDFPGV